MELCAVRSQSRSEKTIKIWDVGNGVGFCGRSESLFWSSGVSSLTSSLEAVVDIYARARLEGNRYVILCARNIRGLTDE
jgi:hypothetical protein